jgi:hypothetical protein
MTMYAMSDVHVVSVGGGCGITHEAGDTWPGERMSINCPQCETVLAAEHHPSWAYRAEDTAQTPDETAQAERDEAAAQKAGIKRMNAMGAGTDGGVDQSVLAALVVQNTALMAQIEQLTAALGTAKTATGGLVETFTAPIPEVDDLPVVDNLVTVGATPVEPVKRGPGRPKKNPTV